MTTVRPSQYVGTSVNRVEGHDKTTGSARYTADADVPDLAYGVLVDADVSRGVITEESVRQSAARAAAAPGVLHVLTPLNRPPLKPPPADLVEDLPLERRLPLSDLEVHHAGQHVAVVVADTFENATYAASLFELRYERLEPVLTAAEVIEIDAGDQRAPVRHGSYLPDHWGKFVEEKLQDRRGDLAEPVSPVRAGGRYTTPMNTHYPIELSAHIAQWAGDTLTVRDTTRWIAGEQRILATCLGLPQDSIRVISPVVGGAFGSKSFLWMHVLLGALAAREVGRPVKQVLTREQMFAGTGHRPRTVQDITLLAEGDGLIGSTEHHTLTETSPVAHFCEPAGLSTRFLYHSPRLRISHRVARINAPTPCFMRGPGEAPGLFALEVAMDELAETLGMDPLELRIRNHIDYDQASDKPWSDKHLLDCYRLGAAKFGWANRPEQPKRLHRNGRRLGWGMATATYPGRRMPAGCRVRTEPGCVRFASATHEIGNGLRTVMTQLAADATGLPLSAVAFDSGDSAFPEAPYSGASQTTASVGSAVLEAAGEWRRRLGALTGATGDVERLMAELPPEALDALSFSVVSVGGPDESTAMQSFGAHFCEVEVDEPLGRVSVTRWVAVFDCGRVLNPKLARSQLMGGITFGIGMALMEQVPYDHTTGRPIGEYYVPTHADRPEFDIDFIDSFDDKLTAFGARGVGEIGVTGVAAAVANAVHHATGKRLRHLPITVEDLLVPFEESSA